MAAASQVVTLSTSTAPLARASSRARALASTPVSTVSHQAGRRSRCAATRAAQSASSALGDGPVAT